MTGKPQTPMPPAHPSRSSLNRRRSIAAVALVAALSAVAVLAIASPAAARFYPACPIHRYLGVLCPGCGATRAVAALLHGHLRQALRLNALFVLLLPAALAFVAETLRRAVRPGPFRWPEPPAAALYATLVAAAVFTLARNLPR